MAVNRYYSSVAQETTLSLGTDSVTTSMQVGGVTGWPTQYPFMIIVDRGTASEELCDVTNAVGTSLTVIRGVDGSSGVPHSLGAAVVHGMSGRDLREPQNHIAAAAAVHGVTGNVVGTTDVQTLTNKTLTSPTINSATISSGTTITAPNISNPTITGGGSWAGSPSIAAPALTGQPTITDYTAATHNHSNAAGGGSTLTSPTVNTPTITNPTVTGGGSWAGSPSITSPTISAGGSWSGNPTFSGAPAFSGAVSFTDTPVFSGNPNFAGQPTITDYTNATHDHSSAVKGGNIPESSVTNLVTDLTALQQPPAAILRSTTFQTITTSTTQTVQFNAHDYDSHTGHNDVTNNDQYKIPLGWGGIWAVQACAIWSNGAGGSAAGMREIQITNSTQGIAYMGDRFHSADTSLYDSVVSALIKVNAGDIIVCRVYQDSGSSLTLNSNGGALFGNGSFMSLYFVRKP